MHMSPSRLFELTKNLSNSLGELNNTGIHIEIGDDFAKYQSYRSQQSDRGPIYPMFDVASSYIDHTNGFWVCGFNANGELVHTQAVRLLDMSHASLATHLKIHRHKYITPDTTPDPDRGLRPLKRLLGKCVIKAISGCARVALAVRVVRGRRRFCRVSCWSWCLAFGTLILSLHLCPNASGQKARTSAMAIVTANRDAG